MRAAALVAFALFAGCSRPHVTAVAAPAASRAADLSARYVHVGPDLWRVEYSFAEPIRGATFARSTERVRDDWRVTTKGVRILHQGDGRDLLVADAPTTTVAIEVPYTALRPEMDYSPFYRFTDAGFLAYTGHLALLGSECRAPCAQSGAPPLQGTLTIVAAAGETVLVRGQPRGAEATLPLRANGTYAYFGSVPAIETRDFVGVVDRGSPPWLRETMNDLVPRLFDLYGAELGRPTSAAERPLLFATYTRLQGTARDLGGNVMRPRVLNLAFGLAGKEVDAAEPSVRRDVAFLVAHEAAHLWNADTYASGGSAGSAWMHEGSADALSFRALRRLDAIDEPELRARFGQALSLCVLSLDDGAPLAASTRRGRGRDFYECGSTIALLTEAALAKHDPRSDLFTFWRAVFVGVNADGEYDEELYFTTLDRLGHEPGVTGLVRRMVGEGLSDPTAELRAALEPLGIETVVASGPLPEIYERRAAGPALRALLPRACSEAIVADDDGWRVTAENVCPGLAVGDVVSEIAGRDLAQRGASAFDAGFVQCRTTRAITMDRRGKASVRVPCVDAPRARPPYLALAKRR